MRLENGISRNHKTPGSLPDHGLLYLSLRKSSDLQWHSICDDLVGFFFSFSSSFFLLPSSHFTVTTFTFRSPPFATVSLCIVIRVDLLTKEGWLHLIRKRTVSAPSTDPHKHSLFFFSSISSLLLLWFFLSFFIYFYFALGFSLSF